MPRLTNRLPAYRLHKSSGQGVVTLSGRTFYLGKFNTHASKAEYDRLTAEWIAGRRLAPPEPPTTELTVSMLIEAFVIWAQTKYRRKTGNTLPDGSPEFEPTSGLTNMKSPLRLLRRMFGHVQVKAFDARSLQAVQAEMVRLGWCRSNVNRQIGRVRRLFSWGCGVPALVKPELVFCLQKLEPLSAESSDVRESEPVRPIDADHARAIKPFVSREVAALIDLQLLTGARAGELCIMRGRDIDTTGTEWIFRPSRHKTKHRGKDRVIILGPKAREIVAEFLKPNMDDLLFSPRDADRRRREALTAARVTPVGTGNEVGDNRVRRPKRTPGDRYTTSSYGRAIRRGCLLAFRSPARDQLKLIAKGLRESMHITKPEAMKLAKKRNTELVKSIRAHDKANVFSPHRMRHTVGTEVRRLFGIEAAQVVLGHASVSTAELYAEKNLEAGRKIAAQIG